MTCLQLLEQACSELSAILQNPVFSSVYRTKAMYVEDQDDFYNMVAYGFVADEEDPYIFLDKINEIEAKYGRNRVEEIRFGPRPLDIDIEIFGNHYLKTEKLTIPHPRIKEREFVLVPLLEILEQTADKELRQKYQTYLDELVGKSNYSESGIKKLGSLQAVLNGSGTNK